MKASARNQFVGTVSEISDGPINAKITIELEGGDRLVAEITEDSRKNLKLTQGSEVVALIKATNVMLVTDLGNYRLSALNQLTGTISKFEKGAVNTEVILQLAGGNSIYATVTNDSVDEMGLKEGASVVAAFKTTTVVLAAAVN